MEISEHIFDRLDESFAQKPINQLIDDGMKPNWGTGSQNLEKNLKFILSRNSFSDFEAEISRTVYYSWHTTVIFVLIKLDAKSRNKVWYVKCRYKLTRRSYCFFNSNVKLKSVNF